MKRRKQGWNWEAYLDDIPDEVGKNLVLFDFLAIVANLFFHDALLVLQP